MAIAPLGRQRDQKSAPDGSQPGQDWPERPGPCDTRQRPYSASFWLTRRRGLPRCFDSVLASMRMPRMERPRKTSRCAALRPQKQRQIASQLRSPHLLIENIVPGFAASRRLETRWAKGRSEWSQVIEPIPAAIDKPALPRPCSGGGEMPHAAQRGTASGLEGGSPPTRLKSFAGFCGRLGKKGGAADRSALPASVPANSLPHALVRDTALGTGRLSTCLDPAATR